jgi:hypothetical protein
MLRRVDPGLVLARQALLTLLSVLLSFGSALALRHAAGLTASVEVLSVALAISLSRIGARPEHRGWRARALSICVLPLVAVGASEVGTLLFQHPDLGDTLFVFGVSATIYVRRFGETARRVATFTVLPLISVLIVPGPVVAGAGASGGSGRWWAALVALIALVWVTVMRALALRAGWISDEAIAPARRPARRQRADGTRRLQGSTKQAAQMALALGVSFALGRWLFGMHWSWMVLSAFIVSSGNRGREDVLHKGVLRVLGAAAGTLSATLIAGLFPAGDAWAIVLIFAVLTLALWLRPRNYAYWAAGMTAALALLYGYYGEHGVRMLADRLEGIVLGTAVAIVAAWSLWPIRTTDVIRRDIGLALRALDRWLSALVDDPDGEEFADPHAIPAAVTAVRRAVATLDPHLALMRAVPAPLRTRIDHLPALAALERVGRWITDAPGVGRADAETVARLRGHVGDLRSANGQGRLPEPAAWERLVVGLEDLAAMLGAPEEAEAKGGPAGARSGLAHGSAPAVSAAVDGLRGSTEKVLGYVNRVHGLALALGEAAGHDGPTLTYAVTDATERELVLTWVRARDVDLPEPVVDELARGRTPSGFPYAVGEPANAPSST